MFPDAHVLLPFLSLGLFGSLHCVGMCGGFVLLAGRQAETTTRCLQRQSLYVVGKALTYAALGMAVASTTQYLSLTAAMRIESLNLRGVLAWAGGGVLVAIGLGTLGLWQPSARWQRVNVRWQQLLLRSVAKLNPAARAFSLGALTGLLPCGLSWAAVALAINARPLDAGCGLLLFGLLTGVPLLGVGLGVRLLPLAWRQFGARALGPLLIVFGLLTALRAGPFDGASCCETSAPTASDEG